MAVPDYQAFMLPLLKYLGDQQEHRMADAIEYLVRQLGLTDEDRRQMLPSGQQATYLNRIQWASTYLSKARLLQRVSKGRVLITQRGLKVLADKPARIDRAFLLQFSEFRDFQKSKASKSKAQVTLPEPASEGVQTPQELLEGAYQTLRDSLAQDLLQRVKGAPPDFFERLFVDLLVKMGYGGSRADAGRAVGRTGDGGIDGIINQDRLGLDVVYVQAKRWDAAVGRPQVQAFAGALSGNQANKGVFIATSDFTKEAIEFTQRVQSKIILIGGKRLADLMIEHGVGVATEGTYVVHRVDSDYFETA